jgi:lipoprotein-releasing system ATP-binding protein
MILEAKKISKSFLHPQKISVLESVSLQIERGQSISIMGRSGEGKTTLLHILGALEEPDSGTISIVNEIVAPANGHRLRNRHIGFVFQAYNLLEDFTALENVLMPLRIARKKIDPAYGMHLLDQVGLANRTHFPAKLLSGGEKQRAAIARALCNDPDLIFADEPSGNLDSANAAIVGDLLFSLVKQKNKSLVLATHDPDLAARCDRRLILAGGSLC